MFFILYFLVVSMSGLCEVRGGILLIVNRAMLSSVLITGVHASLMRSPNDPI